MYANQYLPEENFYGRIAGKNDNLALAENETLKFYKIFLQLEQKLYSKLIPFKHYYLLITGIK
jgi:hypothetical protein